MPVDALISLAAKATVATTTNGSALILAGGTPRYGLFARIIVFDGHSTTTNTATFSVDACYDGVPTTWFVDFVAPTLSLTTTVQSPELYIPFNVMPTIVAGVITAPQVRCTVTIAGGGTASVQYQADIVESKP